MTYDQTLDGSDNGAGGRFMDSTVQVLKSQELKRIAEAKAATEPHLLTDVDIPHLSGATISDLMTRGQLGHLGCGGRRKR